MYPNLSYILEAIFGTEPDNFFSIFQTFGLFLGLAFAASAYVLYHELKRKESEGLLTSIKHTYTVGEPATIIDLFVGATVGFILGFKLVYLIQHFDVVKSDMVDFIFSTQGSFEGGLLGAILNAGWVWYDKNKHKLDKPKTITEDQYPHQRIMDITFVAAIWSLIGAKLFAVLEEPQYFFEDPIGQLFSGSGMAIYGGLIGGFIGTYYYIKNKLKIKPIHVMDAVAPALIMGYAVGRVGCQLSGDGDWGIDNPDPNPYSWLPDWLWSSTYPHNVLKSGVPIEECKWEYCNELAVAVYPTPVYEIIMALIIFGILWALRKRIKVAGVIFFIYMILNGIERFWIEKIRVNATYNIAGMEITQAEIISVLFVIGGIIGCIILYGRDRKKA
ncbi:MAG: prolipoprotein diacylglyceryl transferase [Bacteroidia bacterium]|nr:prolipoprotein diacylglyceryl transferase [Bacteroidia bacterium]